MAENQCSLIIFYDQKYFKPANTPLCNMEKVALQHVWFDILFQVISLSHSSLPQLQSIHTQQKHKQKRMQEQLKNNYAMHKYKQNTLLQI